MSIVSFPSHRNGLCECASQQKRIPLANIKYQKTHAPESSIIAKNDQKKFHKPITFNQLFLFKIDS
jgi:hypothetical protein